MMDKFKLKEKFIKIHDELVDMVMDLNKDSTDNETGKLRSEITRDINNLKSKLKDMVYHIY